MRLESPGETGITDTPATDEATVALHFVRETTQSKVFQLLRDRSWHCREHEGKVIASGQYAGGGGIQGSQRGTASRPGLEIERKTDRCEVCRRKTVWDRWTGNLRTANASASIPTALVRQILQEYDYTDSIEQRKRAEHELIIDHRFPMERWGQTEPKYPASFSSEQIRQKFQLLKKDIAGNHNLLKSRACERCIATGERGTPLGIAFWYAGGATWDLPAQRGAEAERGCVGCGWYDFDTWRKSLNRTLAKVLSLRVLNVADE